MRQFLYAFCLLLLLSSCVNKSNQSKELTHYIPENSAIIFKTNNLETLASDLKNNNLINETNLTTLLSDLRNVLKEFDSLNIKSEAIICVSSDNNYSFIGKKSKELHAHDSLKNLTNDLFKTTIDSILIVSTSKDIIDSYNNSKLKPNPNLEKLFNSSNNSTSLSTFINTNIAKGLTDSIFSHRLNLNSISDWMALDVSIQQDQILLNGVATNIDTLPRLINIFKNTIPQENKTAEFAPLKTEGFISITFDDFGVFNKNLNEYNSTVTKDSTQLELFKSINEIGLIFSKNDFAISLHSTDIIETKDALVGEQSLANTFREINIYNFSKTDLFKSVLSPFVNDEVGKYIELEETVIFSNSEEFLTKIISDKLIKATFINSENYVNSIGHLSDESSMLFVANNPLFKKVFVNNTTDQFKKGIEDLDLNNFQISALQFVQDNNFAHVHGVIQKNQSKGSSNSISEQFNIVLDNDILNTPQIVKNHRTNQKEIIVQDIKNNLYLISNRGKVLWKKQLNGNILGKVEQIDIYKNGRLQLVFATPKRVYVLDRNGKDVNPFPMKFNDEISQPLSVFDYDKKKNYRFLVTQGRNTLMYDSKGKTVKGFNFKQAISNIITQPKHFRIGSKDYIVFAAGNKLYILDRTGKTRINVRENLNFSNNEIFLYKGKFSFTNTKGELVQINNKGNVAKQNLLLPKDHNLTTTSKTLVTLSDNKLNIKSKTIELEFGNFTRPEIFYLRDKIYVALTDLQSQQAFLFDSQTKSIPNFPVYGNSTIQLDNLDRDFNLEFVVKGENNSIILYQIN